MIALDTNVLVRFLVEDEPKQNAQARDLIRRTIEAGASCFVSHIVLCELVWVLETSYGIARQTIADHLHALLRARHFEFSSLDESFRALKAFQAGRGDFADYLIREQARSAGCEKVATFDRSLTREAGFTSP